MPSVLIKNATVIDPVNKINAINDILVVDGMIAEISENIAVTADTVIDATGLFTAPGLIDMHVHLRDFSQSYKEDILTGTMTAAAGGITAVLAMPNTVPPTDIRDALEYIKAHDKKVKVYPAVCITKGMQGLALTDFEGLKIAGAVAASDDGRPVENRELMKQALINASTLSLPVLSHCEDLALSHGGLINEGVISEKLGIKGVPAASEDSITLREIELAEETGCSVHICHVSTKTSLENIRQAKKRGVKVTCETAPHYFTLDETALLGKNANFRMSPPLRTREDVSAVIEAIRDGTIDAIATDHAPHSMEEKADFMKAPNGVIGLETSLSLGISELVNKNVISLSRLIEMMSVNPAKILNVEGGSLSKNKAADIVVFDINESYIVDSEKMHSKSKNTPFEGMVLSGKVKYTFVDGELIYKG